MKLSLMNIEYMVQDGKPVLVLFSRDDQRKRHVIQLQGFKPYFYGSSQTGDLVDLFGRLIKRIEVKIPGDVPEERQKYDFHCEADILYPIRYLVDKKIYCDFESADSSVKPCENVNVPMKVLFFDIEVLTPPEVMAKPMNPIWPIVTIQFANSYDDVIDVFVYTPTEIPVRYSHYMEPDKVKKLFESNGIESLMSILPVYHYPCQNRKRTDDVRARVFFFNDARFYMQVIGEYVNWMDPDVFTGYFCDGFDFPYIIKYCEKNKYPKSSWSPFGKFEMRGQRTRDKRAARRFVDVYCKGRSSLDMMSAYQKWSSGRQGVQDSERPFGLSLDFKTVVANETGFVYDDFGDRIEQIIGSDTLIEYAIKDAYALRLLDEFCDIINHFDRLRRIVGAPIGFSLSNKKLIDVYSLRNAERPLPSTRHVEKLEKAKGALVIAPAQPGIYTNVAAFDLKSLYPSLIQFFNLSPETKSPEGTIFVSHWRYKRTPEGIIPKIVRLLTAQREKLRFELKKYAEGTDDYKRARQSETLYKYLACSVYGVMGYQNFRLYDKDVQESITYLGREATIRLRKVMTENLPVYSDTDSVYIQMMKPSRQRAAVIEYAMNEELRKFARTYGARYPPTVKFERLFLRIFFKRMTKRKLRSKVAKKRYAGFTDDGQLYIIGLQPRSSASPDVTRALMKEFFEITLKENDLKQAIELIRTAWKNFKSYNIQAIAIPKSLHQTSYKTRNPWFEGVIIASRYFGLKFREDRRPRMLYVKSFAKELLDRMAPEHLDVKSFCVTEDEEELPREVDVDWEKMRQVVLRNPFEDILASVGFSWSSVTDEQKLMKQAILM